jgi:hypothetical protein
MRLVNDQNRTPPRNPSDVITSAFAVLPPCATVETLEADSW